MNGADVHLEDPGHLVFGQIGQGDVIAEQEGQAAVVVLEIQALPHTRRHLVDKAEYAFVPAAVLLVHQVGGEGQPGFPAGVPVEPENPPFSLRRFDHGGQAGLVQIEAVIEHVRDFVAVEGQQPVPRPDGFAGRRTARHHPADRHRHRASSFPRHKNRRRNPLQVTPSILAPHDS